MNKSAVKILSVFIRVRNAKKNDRTFVFTRNSKISQGYYRISCAEFRRTEPTTHNLVINLYEWGSAQARPIKRFYAGSSGEVTFHLAENNIHIKEVRITAEFTDKEGGTFEDVYFSEEFQNKTKEIQQQAQDAMEKALDEGYSE